MGIVAWPDSVQLREKEECAICGEFVPLADLTIGMCDFKGVQRFACNSHYQNARELILGWADFLVNQYWIHKVDPQGKTLGEF